MNVSTIIGFSTALFSVLEIVVSWQLLSLTNNHYISSFVGGVCSLIASSVSLRVAFVHDGPYSVNIIAALSFVSAIPVSVAMGSLAARYYYYPEFEACSSTDNDSSCGKYFSGYSCYGNSRSFPSAYSCLSLQSSNLDDLCACVSGSGDCFVFDDIPSCSKYFYGFQRILFSSLVLSVFLFVLCCVQMLLALRSLQDRKPMSSAISMIDRKSNQYGSGHATGRTRHEKPNVRSSSSSGARSEVDSTLFGSEDDEESSDLLGDECTL